MLTPQRIVKFRSLRYVCGGQKVLGEMRDMAQGEPQGDLLNDPGVRGWIPQCAGAICGAERTKGLLDLSVVLVVGRIGNVLTQEKPPGQIEESDPDASERLSHAITEQTDPGIERDERPAPDDVREVRELVFIDVRRIVPRSAPSRVGLLARIPVCLRVGVKEATDVVKEVRIAINVERACRAERRMFQRQELVKRRTQGECVASHVKLTKKLTIVAEILNGDIVGSGLPEKPGCRAVEEKQVDADIAIVAPQTAKTRDALPLTRRFRRIRDRVIHDA